MPFRLSSKIQTTMRELTHPSVMINDTFEDYCHRQNRLRLSVITDLWLLLMVLIMAIETINYGINDPLLPSIWLALGVGAIVFLSFKLMLRLSNNITFEHGYAVFVGSMAWTWLGYEFGSQGGIETGFVGIGYFPPLVAAFALVPFEKRLFAMVATCGGFLLTFFGVHPHNLVHPNISIPFIHIGCMIVIAMMFSQLSFAIVLEKFKQQQAQFKLTNQLSQEVEKRTAEAFQLAQYLENAQENERKHIAREIHDQISQELTRLKFDVYSLRNLLDKHNSRPDDLATRFEELEQRIVRSQTALRKTIYSLRSPELDDLGLKEATNALLLDYASQSSFVPRLNFNIVEATINENMATTIYRILQEAIANVARHAQAQNVIVNCRQAGGDYIIKVTDDGIGFEENDIPKGHYGIRGMRERVQMYQGQFAIESVAGLGTTLHFKIPILDKLDYTPVPPAYLEKA